MVDFVKKFLKIITKKRQSKKTFVPGTMKGAAVDTTGSPKYKTVNKPKKAANIKKGSKIYTDGSTSEPYVLSPAHQPSLRQNEKIKEDMRKDAKNKKLGPDMSRGTVKRKTNKTVYQDSKPNKSNAPRPDYSGKTKATIIKKDKKRAMGRNTHKAAQGLLQRPTRR